MSAAPLLPGLRPGSAAEIETGLEQSQGMISGAPVQDPPAPTGTSWRDDVKAHPAADIFPMMPDAELDVLAKDIAENGLLHPIVWFRDQLIDGRNRVAAVARIADKKRRDEIMAEWRDGKKCIIQTMLPDPIGFVISANLHRRHLTAEQKREIIAKVVKAQPEKSDRAIAREVKADHKTVGAVRAKLETTGEIARLDKTVGADGKARKSPFRQTGRCSRGDKGVGRWSERGRKE